MRITPKKITVRELVDDCEESLDNRVVGWCEKLGIRPSYQMEYIHDNNPDFKKTDQVRLPSVPDQSDLLRQDGRERLRITEWATARILTGSLTHEPS